MKGFPVLSHCDATADTANAATHCGTTPGVGFYDNAKYIKASCLRFVSKRQLKHSGTFILSTESVAALAWWMSLVCSMYSANLWRKLSGSLNITGMAILDNSWKKIDSETFMDLFTTSFVPFYYLQLAREPSQQASGK